MEISTGVLNCVSGKEEEEEEEEDSCVSVRLRGEGEVERRWRDGRLELSYQNGNKKIIRQGRSHQVVLRSDKLEGTFS